MAIACERIVRKNFKKARLIPLPPKIDAGCGLVLRVFESDFKYVKALIEREEIQYEKIFLKKNNQFTEEEF